MITAEDQGGWDGLKAKTDFVQIMDPKMDSGFLEPGETLEDQYDVSRNLLPKEVIGIMDQMLCYEVRPSAAIQMYI